jgi:predicted P-loop ATPase
VSGTAQEGPDCQEFSSEEVQTCRRWIDTVNTLRDMRQIGENKELINAAINHAAEHHLRSPLWHDEQ